MLDDLRLMGLSTSIPIEQLKTVPFFDHSAWSPNRQIVSLIFYSKGEWHAWIAVNDGLQKMLMQPVEADYLGDQPEKPTDPCFLIFDLLAQRSSYSDMYKLAKGIWHDFQNLAASLGKIELFYEASKTKKEVTRFAQTEVEYIVYVCRGIFDLLQEIIALQFKRTDFHDKSQKKKDLPKSFADVIYKSNVRQTPEQIAKRFGMPMVFAEWYASKADFFDKLRYLRNVMAHGGSSAIDLLFVTERGFGIYRHEKHWSDFYDWPQGVELKNDIVPLRPVLNAIIWSVLTTCHSFAELLQRTIQLPKELFPGFRFYTRGHYDRHFAEMETVLRNSMWCDTDASVPQVSSENSD